MKKAKLAECECDCDCECDYILYKISGGRRRHDEYACARTYPQLQRLSTYPQKSVGKIVHFPQNNPCIYIAVDI